MIHLDRTSARRVGLGLLLIAVAGFGGCRGERTDKRPRQFFPDLDDQPKYKAQSSSTFFADGRSMRDPVAGTVAFGAKPFVEEFNGVDFARREGYLKSDERLYTGKETVLDADGKPVKDETGAVRTMYVERTPIETLLGVKTTDPGFDSAYRSFILMGEKKFNIYCVVCHGPQGDGKGTVGTRWSYPLPTWHAEQYQRGGEKGTDGLFFFTIRNGVANVGENVPYPLKMPSYASKVSEREAWAIVEYIRALQKQQGTPLQSVPERERNDLEKRRGATPQAATGTSGRKEGSS
ncbi:MAG: cytochrome c [Phycisphaerae bacterium]|nr:cytochrome c [Phycisphaerae bacterium]